VVGRGAARAFKSGDTLILRGMHPGENRWVRLTVDVPKNAGKRPLRVVFHEVVGKKSVNGFTIAIQPAPVRTVQRHNLHAHAHVNGRLVHGFKIASAKGERSAAQKLLQKKKEPDHKEIQAFLHTAAKAKAAYVPKLLKGHGGKDPFGVAAALKHFEATAKGSDAEASAAAHADLLHKLDVHLTMVRKSEGDPADIFQNVRWQRDLYVRVPALHQLPFAAALVKRSEQFLADYQRRKVTNKGYPSLIRSVLDDFRKTGKALATAKVAVDAEIKAMEKALTSPSALQKAHHAYLMRLEVLVR
jgi:hypothetical protein